MTDFFQLQGDIPSDHGQDTVSLGNPRLGFQAVQDGELAELSIKLLQVVVGDRHSLLSKRMRQQLVASLLSSNLGVLCGRHGESLQRKNKGISGIVAEEGLRKVVRPGLPVPDRGVKKRLTDARSL